MNKMSRRDFMKTGVMGLAGASLTAATPLRLLAQENPVSGSVQIWDFDSTGIDAWVQADKNFAAYFTDKYPQISVNRTTSPWGGYTEKFLTSVAGGAKYDVIYGWGGWRSLFIENNAIQPLDEVVASDSDLNLDDFHDSAKEYVDGKLYGLTWAHMPDFIWYNKTMVEAAGAEDPKELAMRGEWDFDALYNFAKAISTPGDSVPVYGYSFVELGTGGAMGTYSVLLAAMGGKMWNDDFTQSLMNSDENIALWEYVQKFFKEGLSPFPGSGGGLDPNIGFAGQRVGGFNTGPWQIRTAVQDRWRDNFEIGFAPLPKGPGGMHHTVYLNSYYLGAQTQNPELAWAWYKERSFSDVANTMYISVGTGRFPVRKGVPSQKEFAWEDTDVYELITPTMQTYRSSPKEVEFGGLFKTAFDEMVLETRPISAILNQLAEDATALVVG